MTKDRANPEAGSGKTKPVKGTSAERRPANRQKDRPVVAKTEIVLALRRRITLGEFPPGSRLPPHRELRREMNANIVTVGRAIDSLKLEGFLDTQGARGTFVSVHPPHLFRYALVFPSHPSSDGSCPWPRYWDALAKEAMAIQRNSPFEIPIYYDVNSAQRGANSDFERLTDDVMSHRLAGIIFASDPWVVKDTSILDEPGIPRVAPMESSAAYPNVGMVTIAADTLVERALDYFASKGRKRVALLSVPSSAEHIETAKKLISAHGMETRPYWIQTVTGQAPQSAQACIHLMMRDGQFDRPDALLVTDDNLVEHASAGLVDAGVRVPTDVDVVVHCNFPWPTPSVVAVKRIGFDADQVLAACFKSLEEQRRSGKLPTPTTIPALFEDEVVTNRKWWSTDSENTEAASRR